MTGHDMCSGGGERRVVNELQGALRTERKKAREKRRQRGMRDGDYILGSYVLLRYFLLLRYVY